MKRIRYIVLFVLMQLFVVSIYAQQVGICDDNTISTGVNPSIEKRLTNVFPTPSLNYFDNSGFTYTSAYTPSNSTWATAWGESHVFESLLKYENNLNPNFSYELRVGKGGQIYSFVTAAGETIPPQWRSTDYAPWVDEVWQLVAVDPSQNDPANGSAYFIHQAGVYLNDSQNLQTPFYSPQVASHYDPATQSYTTVNWGQHAHIDDNLTAGFKSALLYYTTYTNLGDGVIQVDYLIYNFGSDVISHTNVPWGGVRASTLGNLFVSSTDNTYFQSTGLFSNTAYQTPTTNGWIAYAADNLGNSPSLGLMINNDAGLLRVGDAGNIANRDYKVFSGIRNGFSLSFGKQIRIRNYFLLDDSVDDIQNKIGNLNLQDHTFFGFESVTASQVDVSNFSFGYNASGKIEAFETTTTNNTLELKLQAYDNSYPLFLIEDENGEIRITSDLYTFSNLPYDGKTIDIKLLGFTDSKTTVNIEQVRVCSGDSYTLPDGTTLAAVNNDICYLSNLGTDSATGYTNYVQTIIHAIQDIDILPRSEIVGNGANSDFDIYVNISEELILKPQIIENGSTYPSNGYWSWTGPNGFNQTGRVVQFNPVDQMDEGQYTATYSRCTPITQEFYININRLDLRLDLKVLLNGPFNGTDMDADLNSILPNTHPYDESTFTNILNRTVQLPNPVPTDFVDWVIVSLRTDESTIMHHLVGIVRTDGTIVNPDNTPLIVQDLPAGNYQVAIQHRNHLGVMTETPVSIN